MFKFEQEGDIKESPSSIEYGCRGKKKKCWNLFFNVKFIRVVDKPRNTVAYSRNAWNALEIISQKNVQSARVKTAQNCKLPTKPCEIDGQVTKHAEQPSIGQPHRKKVENKSERKED